MKAQEEIKARLEVAQLYEEMGQLPKASRYYLAAAEIALKGKLFDHGRKLLHKVLELDSENTQAKTYLQKLDKHLESLGHKPKSAPGAQKVNAPAGAAAGSGGVTVPVPTLYLKSEQISAILSQVSSAPNPKFFPFTPLPEIDVNAIERRNQELEAAREAERAKDRTAVESAFGNSGGGFTESKMTSGFLDQAQRSGRSGRRNRNSDSKEDVKPAEGRRRSRRGGNQDLADSIRKKLQGG